MNNQDPTPQRKPILIRLRYRSLASVFTVNLNKVLHQRIARLCVLFEDLRIEIQGIAVEELGRLDECGKNSRSLYFLRRSVGTLYEFADALKEIDQLAEFADIRARFDPLFLRHWSRAIDHFRKNKSTIARVRHHVGGHFGKQAAEHAVENFARDAGGSLEVAIYSDRGGGAKLKFASEIAATALVSNLTGRDTQDKARRLVRLVLIGYRHAVRAVDCITVTYLWDRFG